MKSLLFVLVFFTSCCTIHKTRVGNEKANTDTLQQQKLTPAVVIDYTELDGCSFLLKLQDGQKLQPVNLPGEYKINNLAVLIRFHEVKQMSVCMAGKIVELDYITKK